MIDESAYTGGEITYLKLIPIS